MDDSVTAHTATGHNQDHETPRSLASISDLLSGLIGGRGTHRGLDRVMIFALDAELGILAVASHSPAISLPQNMSKHVTLRAPRGPIARCAVCSEELFIDVPAAEIPNPDRLLLCPLGARVRLLPLTGRRGLHCREELDCPRTNCPAYEQNDQRCWTVEGTLCRDGTPVLSEEKLEVCLRCPAYGVVGVLAIGSPGDEDLSILNSAAMTRLSDHIGALIEANLTARALAKLNMELESRVESARQEIMAKNELLLRSERLAAMGKLAAGLAHEINNPLGVISACVQSLILGGCAPEESRRPLEMISSEVQRISTLVRGLLDLSREQPLALVEADICSLVEQSLQLVSPETENSGVTVHFRAAPSSVSATVDRSQMQQVMVNLALNAIQAMQNGGTLEVSVEKSAKTAEILFSDNGPGMSPTTLEKVFDPFFSTKQETGGVGLGLSVSLSIVEKHGGTIVASSIEGEGTVFRVILPT
jgi:signal transduction histidine kinase